MGIRNVRLTPVNEDEMYAKVKRNVEYYFDIQGVTEVQVNILKYGEDCYGVMVQPSHQPIGNRE